MDSKEILKYLERLDKGTIKLGLDNIKSLLDKLGNPQLNYKTIHVAGTNGKGSVVAMCSSILNQAGYNVGTYTSPHLHELTERICVKEESANGEILRKCFEILKKETELLKQKEVFISYFEFLTGLAFLYFKEKKVDFAVIEVGLGGRLDATNIIKPELSVITNINLDHTKILGESLESIAKEKAGIIKKNNLLITSEQKKEVLKIFKQICIKKKTKLIITSTNKIMAEKDQNKNKQTIITTIDNKEQTIKTSLLGRFQIPNISLVLKIFKELNKKGFDVSTGSILEGLKNVKWPGRFEIVNKKPLIILDSAHNPEAMKKLFQSLSDFKYKNLIVIIGISDNKDFVSMYKIVKDNSPRIIIATKAKYRGLDTRIIAGTFKKDKLNIQTINDVVKATKKAITCSDYNDLILITGSIFTVSEARDLLVLKK